MHNEIQEEFLKEKHPSAYYKLIEYIKLINYWRDLKQTDFCGFKNEKIKKIYDSITDEEIKQFIKTNFQMKNDSRNHLNT